MQPGPAQTESRSSPDFFGDTVAAGNRERFSMRSKTTAQTLCSAEAALGTDRDDAAGDGLVDPRSAAERRRDRRRPGELTGWTRRFWSGGRSRMLARKAERARQASIAVQTDACEPRVMLSARTLTEGASYSPGFDADGDRLANTWSQGRTVYSGDSSGTQAASRNYETFIEFRTPGLWEGNVTDATVNFTARSFRFTNSTIKIDAYVFAANAESDFDSLVPEPVGIFAGSTRIPSSSARSSISLDNAALSQIDFQESIGVRLVVDYEGEPFDGFERRVAFDGFGTASLPNRPDDAPPTLDVTYTNRNPFSTPLTISGREDAVLSGLLPSLDANGNAMTYSVVSPPTTLDPIEFSLNSDGSFEYRADRNQNGTDAFVVRMSNGTTTVNRTVTLDIEPVNDVPYVQWEDYIRVTEGGTRTFSVRVTDPDSAKEDLSLVLEKAPDHGTVTLEHVVDDVVVLPDGRVASHFTASIRYTPDAGFSGQDTFEFELADAEGVRTPSPFPNLTQVLVTPLDNQVIATDITIEAYEDSTSPRYGRVFGDKTVFSSTDRVKFELARGPQNGTFASDRPGQSTSNFERFGQFYYTPDPDFFGTDTLEIRATDGLTSAIATVTIEVAGREDKPVLTTTSFSTNEDQTLTGTLLGTDADGDEIEYIRSSNSDTVGTVTINLDGTFEYEPPANFSGTDTFTVYMRKPGSNSVSSTNYADVTVQVNAVNDRPSISPQTFSGVEDMLVSGQIFASDVEGDDLTFSVFSDPSNGTLDLNADGSFTYTPDDDFNGRELFVVNVSDGRLARNSTMTVNVAARNDAPVLGPQATQALAEDTSLTINANDVATDVDGDDLFFVLPGEANDQVNGSVSLSADRTELTFTPDADFVGEASFDFIVTDGSLQSQQRRQNINYTPVNDRPVFSSQTISLSEDTPVSGQLVATDADGDDLTFTTNSTITSRGRFDLDPQGFYTFTPNENATGSTTAWVTVSDGDLTASRSIRFEITPVNDPPVAADDAYTVQEDGVLSTGTDFVLQFSGNDWVSGGRDWYFDRADSTIQDRSSSTGNVVAFRVDGPGAATPFNVEFEGLQNEPLTTGDYLGARRFPFNDSDEFGFNLSGNGRGNNRLFADFTIEEIAYDDGTLVDFAASFEQWGEADSRTGGSDVGRIDYTLGPDGLFANDSDPDTANLAPFRTQIVAGPSNGALRLLGGGDFEYTPDEDFSGVDTFTYQIIDLAGAESNVATVTLTVEGDNDAPVGEDLAVSGDEDTLIAGQIAATDPDGDDLTFTLDDGPANGSVTVNDDGSFSYTSDANFNGTDSFTVTVSDGSELTDEVTVTVTVDPVNDAPRVDDVTLQTDEAVAVYQPLPLTDIDGDELTYTVISPAGEGLGAITADTRLGYVSFGDFFGTDSFEVEVSDGDLTDTFIVTVNVANVNDAPTADDAVVSGDEDTAINGAIAIDDVDGDDLTATVTSGPINGSVTVNDDGTFSYTGDAEFSGTDSFTVEFSDGELFDTATVSVTVNAVNDAPVADDLAVTGDEDAAIGGTVTASDVDSSELTFALASGPANGSVTVNADGSFSYLGDADFNGSDSFTVEVTDSDRTDTATVSVTVDAVNDAPVADDLTVSGDEDTEIAGTVTATDIDGDDLRFSIETGPANGTVSFDSDGGFRYTGFRNFNGTDSFTLRFSDGDLTDTATVSIAVNAVNDAPVADDLAVFGDEDTAIEGTVTASDVDNDDLTFSLADGPANGSVTVNDDGSFSYLGDANFSGSDSFTVTVTDGDLSDTATVSVTVGAVNDAPVADDVAVAGDEDTTISGAVTASDVDTAELTFAIADGPANGSVTVNDDGSFSYLGNANFNGSDSFTVEVTDGELTDTATVSVTVDAVNDAPVGEDVALSTEEELDVYRPLPLTDIDGDTLTYTVITQPANGLAGITADTRLGYVGDEDFFGTDSYVVEVSDGVLTDTFTVTVNVANVNDAPVTDDILVTGDEDAAIDGALPIEDADGDDLTATVIDGPANGSVELNDDGTFTYTGDADFSGSDSFTVEFSDGELTDTALVDVIVNAINDAPVADDASFAVDENSAIGTVVGTAAATDVEGDTLSFAIVSGNESGAFAIDSATGEIIVSGSLDFETQASYSLTVRATETATSEALTDDAVIDIAINDVDETDGPIEVGIDIDPGDRNNRVSILRNRFLRVAITGGSDFDVRDIDLDSVTFGVDGDDTSALQNRRGRFYGYYTDVNGDGQRDLVLFFDLYDTGIFEDGLRFGEFEMTLNGQLDDGTEFTGTDTLDLTFLRTR